VPIVLKSGSLRLLEPLRPVQACNGIALHLPLPCSKTWNNLANQNNISNPPLLSVTLSGHSPWYGRT